MNMTQHTLDVDVDARIKSELALLRAQFDKITAYNKTTMIFRITMSKFSEPFIWCRGRYEKDN